MRRLLQILLLKPILWASKKFASRPDKERIFAALTALFHHIREHPGKKGMVIRAVKDQRFIIFSDQHRGAKNGADDFMQAEPAYLAALEYYLQSGFQLISLGDNEELWENSLSSVRKNNIPSFELEKRFVRQNRFYKVFGNHDLYWANDPFAWWFLKKIYGQEVNVYEGLVILFGEGEEGNPEKHDHPELSVFLSHGHQGDAGSDGNWFSKFFVARIWAPLQAYLKINPNTPAYNEELKSKHNHIMYEWSASQERTILITGHTHQPVFESLTYLERLLNNLAVAREEQQTDKVNRIMEELTRKKKTYLITEKVFSRIRPSYFNSGCCCYSDGDITGIEIIAGKIILVKWSRDKGREVLEQGDLSRLAAQL